MYKVSDTTCCAQVLTFDDVEAMEQDVVCCGQRARGVRSVVREFSEHSSTLRKQARHQSGTGTSNALLR